MGLNQGKKPLRLRWLDALHLPDMKFARQRLLYSTTVVTTLQRPCVQFGSRNAARDAPQRWLKYDGLATPETVMSCPRGSG